MAENTNTNTNQNTNTNTNSGAPFPDANAARTFLGDYVKDPDFLKTLPDEKVLPWATATHSRFAEQSKQWPQEWRKTIAGDDASRMKDLEKFASVPALYQSYAALQQRISSGELRPNSPFPEKGSPEGQAEWRKLHGVPEKPEDYKIELPENMRDLDEHDKAVVASLQKHMHASNIPATQAQAMASWFFTEENSRIEEQVKKDAQFRLDSEDALRAEWGPDYRENLNRIGTVLDAGPQGFREAFSMARKPDGTKLGDDPAALKFLVDISRQLNPAGVRLPGKGTDTMQGVEAEIATIEKTMRENRAAYNKDEKMQARYRDLIDARSKLQARKAA